MIPYRVTELCADAEVDATAITASSPDFSFMMEPVWLMRRHAARFSF
jgi:hypothetical protein